MGYKDAEKQTFNDISSRNACIQKKLYETKCMSFVTKDDKLLEKYNEIWRKFRKRNIIKKEFGSESLQNRKYLKAEIKSYNQKINTKFCNKKIPKEVFQFIFSSVILIDLFLGLVKIITLECFQNSRNMLFKKKRYLIILLTTQNLLLILIE